MKRIWGWFKARKRRTKVFIILAFIILAFVVRGFFVKGKNGTVTEKAAKADIVAVVSETGNVGASGRVDVYSSATGVIEEIFVGNGSVVKINQNLFRVRSTATPEEKAVAYAAYLSAQVAVQTAKNNLRSAEAAAQKVLDDVKGHDSDETFAQKSTRTAAEVARDNAYDTVRAAEANLTSARFAYLATQNVVVRAPSAGTIANFSARVGDKVDAKLLVLVITNPGDYSVKLALNETDIAKVKTGQEAKITLDAIENHEFKGRVTHVDSVGTNTSGVVTYGLVVEILDPITEIKTEMTADVEIEIARENNALAVSNSAVRPYQGGKAVRIIDPQTKQIVHVPVKVGIKGESKTQILEGISEGQEVVVSLPSDQLKRPGLF